MQIAFFEMMPSAWRSNGRGWFAVMLPYKTGLLLKPEWAALLQFSKIDIPGTSSRSIGSFPL
ncbi:MAG: hypothetical protein C5B50_25440 [Verrucomicrobia bacterium]|nr:MAG: hypothetical protein C5B50_25440 [Verrucomicrobiota bacterium]